MKTQRNRKITRIFGAVTLAVFLTGCGSFGAQETLRSETEPEGLTVVNVDLEDRTPSASQEMEGQEADGSHMDGQETTGDDGAGDKTEPAASENAVVRKQPPEGFVLVLNSEDWGLSFGEPGTQPVGNASPEDLAWYDAYFMGDDSEKVIYLTFDCGYEIGRAHV